MEGDIELNPFRRRLRKNGVGADARIMEALGRTRFQNTSSSMSRRYVVEVQRLLEGSDLVVMEGVRGRRTRSLTLAYRLAGQRQRDGWISQHDGLDLAALQDRMIRPDMTAEEFGASWGRLRWWTRASIYVLAPLVGLMLLVLGPERVLRGNMAFEDTPESRASDDLGSLEGVLLTPRDLLLCTELVRIDAEAKGEAIPTTVTVCWGAAHVPAVMRTLRGELRYRVTDARWVHIF